MERTENGQKVTLVQNDVARPKIASFFERLIVNKMIKTKKGERSTYSWPLAGLQSKKRPSTSLEEKCVLLNYTRQLAPIHLFKAVDMIVQSAIPYTETVIFCSRRVFAV